ncbi:Rhodanese-like domain-containing protein [Melia azedarach]|nr:Rhodanese-like domain-containing protein [Melia azedarach]
MDPIDKGSVGEEEATTLDIRSVKDLLDNSDYYYLDVRTVEEYKKGHVDVAKILNIPYMFNTPQGRVKNPDFLKEVASLCKKDDHLIVGCQSGVRSLYATNDLLSAGFTDVINMGGGYQAWKQDGLKVKVDGKPEEKPQHHPEL